MARHQPSGVIETFIIDWPILAFFGFLFGASSPLGSWWRSRAFFGGLIATGGLTASAMLSHEDAPDWMWMYYRDPQEMQRVTRLMPPAYLAAFAASFAAAVGLRRNGGSTRGGAAAALAAEAAVVAATWDRYHRIGTKQEWEQGTASELVTLKPEGKAKKISGYAPLVFGTLVLGLLIARRSDAAAARR